MPHRMLGEDELSGAMVLVFANKQDLPASLNTTGKEQDCSTVVANY